MKLLIASDLHGSVSATEKVIEAFKKEGADYLLLLGDLLYHGPRNPLPAEYHPATVIEKLNAIKDKIIAVRGNCDSEVDQKMLAFPITADAQTFPLKGRKFFCTHGHLYDPTPDLTETPDHLVEGDIFAFGHVHLPILTVNPKGILVLNPGSVTIPREGHPPTYAVMDDHQIEIKTFDGDVYLEKRATL